MTDTTLSRHSATIKIPFANEAHATIAKRAILVDRELNAHLVERTMSVEGSVLIVTYTAVSVRLLRLATNGFMEHINLVIRTIHEFAPSSQGQKDVEDICQKVEHAGIAV